MFRTSNLSSICSFPTLIPKCVHFRICSRPCSFLHVPKSVRESLSASVYNSPHTYPTSQRQCAFSFHTQSMPPMLFRCSVCRHHCHLPTVIQSLQPTYSIRSHLLPHTDSDVLISNWLVRSSNKHCRTQIWSFRSFCLSEAVHSPTLFLKCVAAWLRARRRAMT
jgi:hypothetical protein